MIETKIPPKPTALFTVAFAQALQADLLLGGFGEDEIESVVGFPPHWPTQYFENHSPTVAERATAIFRELPSHQNLKVAGGLSDTPEVLEVIQVWESKLKTVSLIPIAAPKILLIPSDADSFAEISPMLSEANVKAVVIFETKNKIPFKSWRSNITEVPVLRFKNQKGISLALNAGYGIPHSSSVHRCARDLAKSLRAN